MSRDKADEMRPRRGNYIETEARPRHNHEAEARPRRCIKTSRRGRGSTFAALRLPQGETSASRHTSLESNNRLAHLHKFITLECPQSSHSRLKKHCTTRCVEKQTAVFVFKELFPAVVATLDDMTSWSGETAGKAATFLRTLDNNFILAMDVLHAVLAVTKPLSVKLQGVSQDIHPSSHNADHTVIYRR